LYLCSTHLRLVALLEKSVLANLLGGLVLGEVAILAGLVQHRLVQTRDIHLGRCSNDISGVYPAEGDAVDFEGTGDEEDTLGKVLEKNDALATESTSEENDDGTGLERGARLRRAGGFAGLESQLANNSIQNDSKFLSSSRQGQTTMLPTSPEACHCPSHPSHRLRQLTFFGALMSSAG
jgi:hypothetical protein